MTVLSVRSAVYLDTILQFLDTKRIDLTARVKKDRCLCLGSSKSTTSASPRSPRCAKLPGKNIQTRSNFFS